MDDVRPETDAQTTRVPCTVSLKLQSCFLLQENTVHRTSFESTGRTYLYYNTFLKERREDEEVRVVTKN